MAEFVKLRQQEIEQQSRTQELQTNASCMDAEIRMRTKELEEAKRLLQAANQEMEALIYSVSHDLRAPLRHLDGFSKLLHQQYSATLPVEAREYVTTICDSAAEMSRMMEDLLDLARLSPKKLSRVRTELNSLVESVVSALSKEVPQRKIEWKVQPLPVVECDPSLMKQVFLNLLSNALKYTRPRKPAKIEVGAMPHATESVFFVRDNGVGFDMKRSKNLFGIFQRLHRIEEFEGTGVGLATVQCIIRKHGGRVWAEAEPGQGAIFYFTLPLS